MSSTKFDEDGLIEIVSKFFGTLAERIQLLLQLYSNQDDLDPASLDVPYAKRPELDRWIISKYNKLIKEVTADMDQYDHMKAVRKIQGFRYRRYVQLVYQKSKKKILGGRTGRRQEIGLCNDI